MLDLLGVPNFAGDVRCPRCGEHSVCKETEYIFRCDPGPPPDYLPKRPVLAAVEDGSGGMYAPKKTLDGDEFKYFVMPTGGDWEYIEIWEDFELVSFQEKLGEADGDSVCSWCFSTFDMKELIRKDMRR